MWRGTRASFLENLLQAPHTEARSPSFETFPPAATHPRVVTCYAMLLRVEMRRVPEGASPRMSLLAQFSRRLRSPAAVGLRRAFAVSASTEKHVVMVVESPSKARPTVCPSTMFLLPKKKEPANPVSAARRPKPFRNISAISTWSCPAWATSGAAAASSTLQTTLLLCPLRIAQRAELPPRGRDVPSKSGSVRPDDNFSFTWEARPFPHFPVSSAKLGGESCRPPPPYHHPFWRISHVVACVMHVFVQEASRRALPRR